MNERATCDVYQKVHCALAYDGRVDCETLCVNCTNWSNRESMAYTELGV